MSKEQKHNGSKFPYTKAISVHSTAYLFIEDIRSSSERRHQQPAARIKK